MPGIVRPATATLVMPNSLSRSYEEVFQFVSLVNVYADGSSSRKTMHTTPRRRWAFTKRLAISLPSPAVAPYPYQQLRDFIVATRYGMDPFYFYNYREAPHDPSGVAQFGRYKVVFRGNWNMPVAMPPRIEVGLVLEEIE